MNLSSSGLSSNPVMRVFSPLAGPYDERGHSGFPSSGVRSFFIDSALRLINYGRGLPKVMYVRESSLTTKATQNSMSYSESP